METKLTKEQIIEQYGLKLIKENVGYVEVVRDYCDDKYFIFNKDTEGYLKFPEKKTYPFIQYNQYKLDKKDFVMEETVPGYYQEVELEYDDYGKLHLELVLPEKLTDSYDVYRSTNE